MEFLNLEHQQNYKKIEEIVGRMGEEHKALFYIIAGNKDLFKQINKIYNFKKGMLQNREQNEDDGEYYFKDLITSSSSKKLINLGVQLFNNTNKQNVLNTFAGLDVDNFKLALNAIKIRFNK